MDHYMSTVIDFHSISRPCNSAKSVAYFCLFLAIFGYFWPICEYLYLFLPIRKYPQICCAFCAIFFCFFWPIFAYFSLFDLCQPCPFIQFLNKEKRER